MFEISINEDADEELNAAAAFYESREPGLGETFLHELSITLQLLMEYPLSYQIMFDQYRRAQIRRFPYGVVYYIGDEKIIVLAVAHSSRRPGYWRKRK